MEKENKKMVGWIISSIISIILFNLGVSILNKEKIISIITITISFIFLYLSYYTFQIKNNEKRVRNLEDKFEKIEDLIKIKSDIKLLKRKVFKNG